jgi:hypothetical protein
LSGLCALGQRGGSKGCFVLTNLKANTRRCGSYRTVHAAHGRKARARGLLSTNILQILSDLPFRIGVRVRVPVTAKFLPGHRGTNFFVVFTLDSFFVKSTQHRFGPSTCMVYFGNINNNKASGLKSFGRFSSHMSY